MEIRLARPEDAEAIRAIYNRAVTTSTVTFDLVPRTLDEQLAWQSERSGAHAVIVADDTDVIGFASLSPYRLRPAYSTTVESSVYVRHDRRGEGIGRTLMTEVVSLARKHGFHALIARVVGGHAASIAVHESVGFTIVGTEREIGRKFRQWLDVVVLECLLNEAPGG